MKKEEETRVDHTQYDPVPSERRPLATASENEPVPTKPMKIYCDCGESEYWCTKECEMELPGVRVRGFDRLFRRLGEILEQEGK